MANKDDLTLALCDGPKGCKAIDAAILMAKRRGTDVGIIWDNAKGDFITADLSIIEREMCVWIIDPNGNIVETKRTPRE